MNVDLPVTDELKHVAYKLRHKPSGLFYRPSQGYNRLANLSKRGKLYAQKPSFSWIKQWRDVDGKVKDGNPSEWEIVIFNG